MISGKGIRRFQTAGLAQFQRHSNLSPIADQRYYGGTPVGLRWGYGGQGTLFPLFRRKQLRTISAADLKWLSARNYPEARGRNE